ncbi:MAG: type II toxin-antitoxin system HicA family toxin [Candidatus Riflebacteria bacterium]|nr:type II toxin-antitoxin system HicA family toxin [Candidatus Riflebacteria bacterium]MBR4330645.1 type II toxin-antitoxin system HicA family toxin [Candidatus Riflebacteria bacterium]MBR4571375.1 type II toxin-antitoxin system HicA family toxin [Candidatus Riflebacteria bacterium]
MRFKELEKIIKNDGWYLVRIVGSHHHYKHPIKKGIVTIPHHNGDVKKFIVASVLAQAGLK